MISCEAHDCIEIVCMYRYRVRLTLGSGSELEGVALDTGRNKNREECITISDGDADNLVVLDSITKMEALVENPHFKIVNFK
ncbi:MAG: Rho-binding antiterminator [Porticoccus sp.]|nr:Rho-binding antiterminator [Porticoccus sp.]